MSRRFRKQTEVPVAAAPKPRGKPGRKPIMLTTPAATASPPTQPAERVPTLTDQVSGFTGSQAPNLTVEHMLRNLGQMWATTKEAAAMLGISEPTLFELFKREPRAKRIFEDGKLVGNVSQRRRNIVLAEKNAIMSIFLSKNHLGMKDNVDVDANINHSPLLVLLKQLDNGQHGKVIGEEPKTIEHAPAPAGKVIREQA